VNGLGFQGQDTIGDVIDKIIVHLYGISMKDDKNS